MHPSSSTHLLCMPGNEISIGHGRSGRAILTSILRKWASWTGLPFKLKFHIRSLEIRKYVLYGKPYYWTNAVYIYAQTDEQHRKTARLDLAPYLLAMPEPDMHKCGANGEVESDVVDLGKSQQTRPCESVYRPRGLATVDPLCHGWPTSSYAVLLRPLSLMNEKGMRE